MPSNKNRLFLTTLGIAFYGISIGVAMAAFNNFLFDTYHLGPGARGQLEFPRELPGFLTAATAGLLFFLTDKRKAIVAALVAGVGQFCMVSFKESYSMMVLFMMIASVGDHLYFPIKSALVLACSQEHNQGRILGNTGSFELIGIVIGGLLTRLLAHWNFDFLAFFSLAAGANLMAALVFSLLPHDNASRGNRIHILLRKKYSLYYVLEILFGARKQIFLTFGPWVLIQVFGCGVEVFAILTIVGHLLAFAARPLVGRGIDHFGERLVLMADGALLFFVCLGYAFASHIPIPSWCLPAALACFVMDQVLFFVDIAKTTYLAKTVESRSDLSPSLTAGVSINHIASMTIPFMAGAIWSALGHEILFVCASGIALLIVIASSWVPRKESESIIVPTVPLSSPEPVPSE